MKASITPITVTRIDGTNWRLENNVCIQFGGFSDMIRRGLVLDFASVPKILRPFFKDAALYSAGALFHDDAYTRGYISKWIADAMLFELIAEDGMPITAFVMWLGVALFGFKAWNDHRKADK